MNELLDFLWSIDWYPWGMSLLMLWGAWESRVWPFCSMAMLALALQACGSEAPVPFRVQAKAQRAGHEAYFDAFADTSAQLNARCGSEVVAFGEEEAPIEVVWMTWPEFHAQTGAFAVSKLDVLPSLSGTAYVATSGLPPEIDYRGVLSTCDASRLWLHWVGTLAGVKSSSNKNLAAFNHPNCTTLDLVGQLAEVIHALHPDACP